jgi:DNA-binding NarL/FixJ family response regulator
VSVTIEATWDGPKRPLRRVGEGPRSKVGFAGAAVVFGSDDAVRGRVEASLRRAGWRITDAERGDVRADAAVVVAPMPDALGLVADAKDFAKVFAAVVDAVTADGARDLLTAGADAVVVQNTVDRQLAAALAAAAAGLVVVPRAKQAALARRALTAREKQTLGMVVMGFSNAEIARKLYVAESTVKSHLSSAFAKLGVRTRSAATELILDPQHGVGTGILAISGEAEPLGPK